MIVIIEAYGTKAVELLLAALARSYAGCASRPGLLVDLEGHGRDPSLPGLHNDNNDHDNNHNTTTNNNNNDTNNNDTIQLYIVILIIVVVVVMKVISNTPTKHNTNQHATIMTQVTIASTMILISMNIPLLIMTIMIIMVMIIMIMMLMILLMLTFTTGLGVGRTVGWFTSLRAAELRAEASIGVSFV